MSLFGWRNPNTGTREKDSTLAGSKWRVWHEMQEARTDRYVGPRNATGAPVCHIWTLEPSGSSSRNETSVRPLGRSCFETYFWASPADAKACETTSTEILSAILIGQWEATPQGPIESVIIYRAFDPVSISAEDPAPPEPDAEEYRETPESLLQAMQFGTVDPQHCQTMALLWIAEALQHGCWDLLPGDGPMFVMPRGSEMPNVEGEPEYAEQLSEEARAELRAQTVRERNPKT